MKRLLILLSLFMLVVPAHAVARQEWYVVKTTDGAYAFDANGIETDIGSGVKGVSIVIATRASHKNADYTVDCHTELVMVDETARHADPSWSENGPMKIAADVACGRQVSGAVRVKSEKAALAKLKTLSK